MKSTVKEGKRMVGVELRANKPKSNKTIKPTVTTETKIKTVILSIFIVLVGVSVKITEKPQNAPINATSTATSTIIAKNVKTSEKGNFEPNKAVSKDSSHKLEIVKQIAQQFPENKTVMLAIAMEESGLNPQAVNYNCRYKLGGSTYDKLTGSYIDTSNIIKEKKAGYVSTWCRSGHEKFAWSKDGGILQIHNPTAKEMTVHGNLAKAKVKYETQGLTAWTAYSTGRYKKHIKDAQNLLAMI